MKWCHYSSVEAETVGMTDELNLWLIGGLAELNGGDLIIHFNHD